MVLVPPSVAHFLECAVMVSRTSEVFSQGVPHVADKKNLSAPLATEPQASESLTHCAPPGEGRAQAADPKTLPSPQKGYKLWLLWEMVGLMPWTFGGLFLWPQSPGAAGSFRNRYQQQPRGSQRASTLPRRPRCTSLQTLTSCNAGHA